MTRPTSRNLGSLSHIPFLNVPCLGERIASRGHVDEPVRDQRWVSAVEQRKLDEVLCLMAHESGEGLHPFLHRDRHHITLEPGVMLRMPVARVARTGVAVLG